MELDRILASSCRIRIIRILYEYGRLYVMKLVRLSNSTYNQVNLHLQILKSEELIFDEHYGRLRVIWLNMENPRTVVLLEALRILKSAEEIST